MAAPAAATVPPAAPAAAATPAPTPGAGAGNVDALVLCGSLSS